MLRIGEHYFESPIFLAPMAGITDLPFRQLCWKFGAGLATSEMVTSDTSFWNSHKSASRLARDDQNLSGIRSIQIAGSEPAQLADAAQKCVELGAEIIDINMGCPVKKVCKKLAGSALLRDEELVGNILSAVVAAVDVPVTLKTRTGWCRDNKNGPQIAKLAESIGVAAIAIHGRTRECRFEGEAEYDTIAEIVDRVSIPVLANGDIHSAYKAREVMERTGAAGLLVGRAAFGNPWIFSQIRDFLLNGRPPSEPSLKDREAVLQEHLDAIYSFYGEQKGVQIARKHFAWYCQGLEKFEKKKKQFNALDSAKAQKLLTLDYFHSLHSIEEKAA